MTVSNAETLDNLIAAKEALVRTHLIPSMRAGVANRQRARYIRNISAGAEFNVHAMGVGFKTVAGKQTPDLCIRFYVLRKLPLSLIAPVFRLPASVDGLPTDVIEQRPSSLLAARKKHSGRTRLVSLDAPAPPAAPPPLPSGDKDTLKQLNRPIYGGVAASNARMAGGTLGCFCRSTSSADNPNSVFLLSNSHVFGGAGKPPDDQNIVQPPLDIGNGTGGPVALFTRSVPIDFTAGAPNRVDAAIARIDNGVPYLTTIGGIGAIAGTASPIVKGAVRKCGMSSGVTQGVITDISHSPIISLGSDDPTPSFHLTDQIYIEPLPGTDYIAFHGDSGAVIVDDARNAVGLLCGGDPVNGKWAVANKMSNVLSELLIALL